MRLISSSSPHLASTTKGFQFLPFLADLNLKVGLTGWVSASLDLDIKNTWLKSSGWRYWSVIHRSSATDLDININNKQVKNKQREPEWTASLCWSLWLCLKSNHSLDSTHHPGSSLDTWKTLLDTTGFSALLYTIAYTLLTVALWDTV